MLLILNLWNDVLFCGGAIIGRPFSVPLSPPLIRLCRQLPSMGALLIPLLEERWHAMLEWWLLFGVLFLFLYHHPSVVSVDSSPLWEPYLPLLEERWHAMSEWWLLFDVLFSHFNTLRQADMACLIY